MRKLLLADRAGQLSEFQHLDREQDYTFEKKLQKCTWHTLSWNKLKKAHIKYINFIYLLLYFLEGMLWYVKSIIW